MKTPAPSHSRPPRSVGFSTTLLRASRHGWNKASCGWMVALLVGAVALLPSVRADDAVEPGTTDPDQLGNEVAALIQQRLIEFTERHARPPFDPESIEVGDKSPATLESLAAEGEDSDYVRLALAYLTRIEPGAGYGDVLSGLTRVLGRSEEAGSRLLDEPLLPLLFELREQLPEGNSNRYEMEFVEATSAGRGGDLERQEQLLRGMLDKPVVPARLRAMCSLALGESLEQQNRYADAVELYRGMNDVEAGRRADGLLRAMLISLQLDDRQQALEIVKQLRELPALAAAAAEADWQVADARGPEPDRIEEHWNRSDEWWPRWERLRQRIGVRRDEGHLVVPYLGQRSRVRSALVGAAREGRRREFFQVLDILAHAARWLPGGVTEWSTAVSPIGLQLAPNHASELRDLLIEMNEALEPQDHRQRRQKQLMLALAYIDEGQAEKALEQVEAFGSEPQPNDAVAQAIRRLWGLVLLSLDRDLDPAIRQLEQALYGDERELDRAATVATLAELLNASGRYAEERDLLNTELENPQVQRNQRTHQRLRQRYAMLTQQRRVLDIFHQAVRDWRDARNLAWYPEVEPDSLDDPRLEDIEAVLNDPEKALTTPGQFKLYILLALDPEQPELRKLDSLGRAVDLLWRNTNSRSEALRMILDLVEDTRFPERLRAFVLARATSQAASQFDPHAALMLSLPESGLFDEDQAATAAIVAEFIEVDPDDGEALYELFERRTNRPMDRAGVSITMEVARQLARIGRTDLLARMADQAPELDYAVEVRNVSAEFALDLARLRRVSEELEAIYEPLSDIALSYFPGDEIERPEALDDLRDPNELGSLGLDDALAVQLYLIKEGRIGFGGIEFWHDFIRNANFNNARPKLALELIEAILENETDDLRRSLTMLYAPEFIDIDDPGDRKAMLKILRTWKDREDAPRSMEMLEFVEAQTRQRTGESVDWDQVLGDSDHPILRDLRPRYLLGKGLSEDRPELLRRELDRMDSSQMFSDAMLTLALPALEAAGRDTELAIARRQAREQARELIEESWMSGDYGDAVSALRLLEELEEDAVELPDGWMESVARKVGSEFRSHVFKGTALRLLGQWDAALDELNAAIDTVPTYYALYFDRARILAELDRPEKALADLELYLRYCHDELEYSEAEALRDRLK